LKTSSQLKPGDVYTRADLERRFGIHDATLKTGIFRPLGHDSVWLFITIDKTSDRTQYGDRLDGDDLWMEGQTKRRKDALLIGHESSGLELLLFLRKDRYEFEGAGFRYEGPFRYVSHDVGAPGTPNRFHLRRVAATPPAGLMLVRDREGVREGVRRFNEEAGRHRERCRSVLRTTSYWVFDAGSAAFGPSKFVGFAGMTFELYERFASSEPTGSGFDGHRTREAIERAMTAPYAADESLSAALDQWATSLLGRGALAGVDRSKWAFVVLPAPEDPESEAATDSASSAVTGGGQGFQVSPRVRRAIERHAVERARAHFRGLGFAVQEFGKPFDLLCTRDAERLYVEVKGTSGAADAVFLTRNEVAFARSNREQMALFLVHGIVVGGTDESPVLSGGVELPLRPWDVDAGALTPVSYRYELPE